MLAPKMMTNSKGCHRTDMRPPGAMYPPITLAKTIHRSDGEDHAQSSRTFHRAARGTTHTQPRAHCLLLPAGYSLSFAKITDSTLDNLHTIAANAHFVPPTAFQ